MRPFGSWAVTPLNMFVAVWLNWGPGGVVASGMRSAPRKRLRVITVIVGPLEAACADGTAAARSATSAALSKTSRVLRSKSGPFRLGRMRRPGRAQQKPASRFLVSGCLEVQQRFVRRCHQIVCRHRIGQLRVGCSDGQRVAVRLDAARGHRALNALSDYLCRGAVAVGEDRRELIAAPAEAEVMQAHLVAQGAGHLAQAVVARQVAVEVVDLLEIVEIGEQEAERAVQAA